LTAGGPLSRIEAVSEPEIDAYLANLEEPKRTTLRELRQTIHDVIPDAEQCISYGMPAFRLHGKVVAGFAAFTNHLSYLPHSGSVLSALADDLAAYVSTPGSLHFPVDQPLPRPLVEKLIEVRLREVRQPGASRSASASPGLIRPLQPAPDGCARPSRIGSRPSGRLPAHRD
jgi:uncharacterized protein YdhG (YjbR/CyaY superfamily)